MTLTDLVKDKDSMKWLKYGFEYVTNTHVEDPKTIISYLKTLRHYSDDDIITLAHSCYSGDCQGNVRRVIA